MTTTSKKTGNNNAAATLADINNQIAQLQSRRVTLAEPLKERYLEMVKETGEIARQITELDATWKPSSLKPKAETKIAEILTTKGQPMSAEEIVTAVGGVFSPWKVKNTLKKKSTGAKAVFTVNDGRYAVKSAAA